MSVSIHKVKVEIDKDADAGYIRVSSEPVSRTVELNNNVLVDLDSMGMVVGIEVLGLGTKVPFDEIFRAYHVRSEVQAIFQCMRTSIESPMSFSDGPDAVSNVRSQLHLTAC
ncbi:DUF2283 domain-containing protein [Changpingibacter yushuensis]|uniref:DUF2283 domain-containing protein n=1 Tax=Changpingibacter yushuensis TaxID=2758440 RepID=UPI0015F489B9|nr:DUF2283 domain-containing protein [Changpingibacter yushuensis]